MIIKMPSYVIIVYMCKIIITYFITHNNKIAFIGFVVILNSQCDANFTIFLKVN